MLKKLVFSLTVLRDVFSFIVLCLWAYLHTAFRRVFPLQPKSLKNERILITGSANGLGREICLQLATTEAVLICWDLVKRDNEHLIEELKEKGASAHGFVVDITDRQRVECVAKEVMQELGEVTMIINNAGIMPCHEFLSHNPREIERVFQVNVLSHLWVIRSFLHGMIERKKGHIVEMCGVAGLVGLSNLVPFCGSQHALHGIIEALKDEVSKQPGKPDVKFTTVFMGVNNTAPQNRFLPLITKHVDPEYIAKTVVDGIRRNHEFVYVPGIVQWVGMSAKALLPKLQRAAVAIMQKYATNKDHKE